MPIRVNLNPWERKKAAQPAKPEELKNVAVTEKKEPMPVPPPRVVQTLSDVRVDGRHKV
jgi:hypothetical protein